LRGPQAHSPPSSGGWQWQQQQQQQALATTTDSFLSALGLDRNMWFS